MSATKTNIVIPEHVLCGFVRFKTANYLHGVVAPNDKKGKERINKTLSKSKRQYYALKGATEHEYVALDNTPMTGFKILDNFMYSDILLLDPRGFQFEITVDNFIYLTKHAIIENGEILTPCVFARKTQNPAFLVPVSSDYYELGKKFAKIRSTKVNISKVPFGANVTLHNGIKGIYLGKYYPITLSFNYDYLTNTCTHQWKIQKNKKYYFLTDQCVYVLSTPKVSTVHNVQSLKQEEVYDIVNQKRVIDAWNYEVVHGAIVTTKRIKLKYTLTETNSISSHKDIVLRSGNNYYYVTGPVGTRSSFPSLQAYNIDIHKYYASGTIKHDNNRLNARLKISDLGDYDIFYPTVEVIH